MSARIIVETDEGVVVFRAEAEYRDLLLATPSFSNAKARSLWAGIRRGVRDVEALKEGRDPERPSERAMRLSEPTPDRECGDCGHRHNESYCPVCEEVG